MAQGSSSSDPRTPLMSPVGTCVTCCGVKATLHTEADGSIIYTPVHQPHGCSRRCYGVCGDKPQHLKQRIPGVHVAGAALESPNSFRVWFFQPRSSKQQTAAPRFRLHKTLPLECSTGSEASSLVQQIRQAAAWCGKEKPPRVLAIINPKSGQGRAVKLFQSCVQPVLEGAAGMSVTSMVTQHAGHASQLVAGLNLDSVDLLAVVGGDGLVFEGLQGLLSRPDWDRARLLPITHIPGGSGNGLAHSCGLHDSATAAFAICKRVVSPMDVASALQPPNRRMYIMLSTTYGMMSNLDVNTEPLRWMGDVRFTLGALWEILKLQSYHASIAWLPAADQLQQPNAAAATLAVQNSSSAASKGSTNSHAGVLEPPVGSNAASEQSAEFVKAAVGEPAGAPGRTVSLQDFPAGPGLPLLKQLGPHLPAFVPQQPGTSSSSNGSSSVPLGWRVMHEPLQLWSLINPPYIAAQYRANPWGCLNSGHMNMMWVKGLKGMQGRLQALDVQVKAEQGLHGSCPCLEHETMRAMMFIPRDSNTYLQLDGEVVPSVPLYLEVHNGLIRVVINPAHPDEPAASFSRAAATARNVL